MKRIRNSQSGNEISFRPKFRRAKDRADSVSQSFIKSAYRRLRASLKKGRGKRSGYSRGLGAVHKKSHSLSQRVVVKARIVKNRAGSLGKHVLYAERRGVGENGERGVLFSKEGPVGENDKQAWIKEAEVERHHFRLIVSPENAASMNLEEFAKDFMAGVEKDLGTELKWLSVVHRNTDNPHVHFIIRGVTASGEDLVINRAYISSGMRALGSELATKQLGYRRDLEIEKERANSVFKERFTWLDRKLLENGGVIDVREKTERKRLLIGRLQFLKSIGLSSQSEVGVWRVDSSLEEKLKELGRRGDIIRTIGAMSGRHIQPVGLNENESVTGRVLAAGVQDELSGKRQVIIESNDGNVVSVILSEGKGSKIRRGKIVTVTRSKEPERGTFRGRLFGNDDIWVNVRAHDRDENRQRTIRAAAEFEREEDEMNQRRRAAQYQGTERVRSQFLRKLRDKGREI